MAVYAAAYLICGNVRIGVCLGMAISMIHGMIDHYVMLFRGTPVMLSDIAAIGTAANVSKGYSAPMELSVLRAAAAAVLFCVSVCLMQRSFKVHKRWYFRRLFSLPCVLVLAFIAYTGIQTVGTGLAFWQSSRQYSEIFYFLRCADQLVCQAAGGLQRGRAFCRTERIYRQTGHENAQSDCDHERILLGSRLGRCA